MKALYQSLIAIGALALAGMAYAQVPNTNDTSDGTVSQNTGMGTGALGGPIPVNLTGTDNTAAGYEALFSNTGGADNTALGASALQANSTGGSNTAVGYQALHANEAGSNNTASGVEALFANKGNENTASGYQALYSNSTGNNNTASGAFALFSNTDGVYNTAFGWEALYHNIGGANNTAAGLQALLSNTSGSDNSAYGYTALYKNTTGTQNTASGYQALYSNKTGGANTASGVDALYHNTSGHYNIAEGYKAGFNLTTGSYNIDIGNSTTGVAAESGVIRIGTQVPTPLQSHTYIAGIYNNTSVSGLTVVVDPNGQLGAVASSERFKTGIAPMESNSTKLEQLRPVTFHLKTDPKGALRYGLIAEEVAKVYPELVIRDDKGRIDGVRYDELAPMLLNEVQQQAAEIRYLKQQQLARVATQDQHSAAQDAKISQLMGQLAEVHATLMKLQSKDELVAER
ncbi:MAG TPA: tail fiber domain-containing protein [Steroidobacteraceae bacterium]|jgi:hypothetical protein|nr:tail fiber domain-containing protein [Steroidobacteraceae bacterium]